MRRLLAFLILSACAPSAEREADAPPPEVTSAELLVYQAALADRADSTLVLPTTDADESEVAVIRDFGSPFTPADSGAWADLGARAAEAALISNDSSGASTLRVVAPSDVEEVQRAAPGSVEYVQFSRVGFSPSGNVAAVLVRSMCGFNSGGASYLLLRRVGGRWEVVTHEPAWII